MRTKEKSDGFSLIEVMVVVLVIAVLLAIAVPTFLAARERAQRRAAQSAVRNAFVAQQIFYAGEQEFSENFVELKAIDPALDWSPTPLDSTNAAPTEPGLIYYDVTSPQGNLVVVATKGKNNKCYWMRTVASPGLPRFLEQDECAAAPDEADFLPTWQK